MSNHSGIDISTELATTLAEFLRTDDRALVLKIKGEECILDSQVAGSQSLEGDLEAVAKELGDQARYTLIRVGSDEYIFGNYVPDSSGSRDKMIYASSSPLIKKRLPTHKSYFWTDASELVADVQDFVGNRDAPITDRVNATGEEALTAKELSEKRQADAERTTRAHQQSGANVGLEIPEDAELVLKKLGPGSFVGLAVRGEELHMHTHAEALAAHNVQTEFGPGPGYGVYQGSNGKNWFIYKCPDESTAKDRMIAASCRNGVLDNIKRLVTIDETIETSDEIVLESEDKPVPEKEASFVGTEIGRIKRPSKPGRVRK